MDVIQAGDYAALKPPTWKEIRDGAIRWFVQYNPLYLFSACSMLSGVFLISRHLEASRAEDGQFWLLLVMEGYQYLVLAGVWLLVDRIRQLRPAVMLSLILLCLCGDITYLTENASVMGGLGVFMAVAWTASLGGKLYLVSRIFRLRVAPLAWVILAWFGLCVAVVPQLLSAGVMSPSRMLEAILFAGFGPTALAVMFKPGITFTYDASENARALLGKIVGAMWIIFGVAYLYHIRSWVVANQMTVDVRLVATSILTFTMFVKDRAAPWIGVGVALLLAFMNPVAVYPTAAMTAFYHALQGYKQRDGRLYTLAILLGYLAFQAYGWSDRHFTSNEWWPADIIAAGLLAWNAWRMRSLFAGIILAAGGSWKIIRIVREILSSVDWSVFFPSTSLSWGLLLLFLGVLALGLGVAANWTLRGRDLTPE